MPAVSSACKCKSNKCNMNSLLLLAERPKGWSSLIVVAGGGTSDASTKRREREDKVEATTPDAAAARAETATLRRMVGFLGLEVGGNANKSGNSTGSRTLGGWLAVQLKFKELTGTGRRSKKANQKVQKSERLSSLEAPVFAAPARACMPSASSSNLPLHCVGIPTYKFVQ